MLEWLPTQFAEHQRHGLTDCLLLLLKCLILKLMELIVIYVVIVSPTPWFHSDNQSLEQPT